MRVTSKGQVTIPVEIRQKLGIMPHTEVEFVLEGDDRAVLRKVNQSDRGDRLIETMRGKGSVSMSTDDIMALTRGERPS